MEGRALSRWGGSLRTGLEVQECLGSISALGLTDLTLERSSSRTAIGQHQPSLSVVDNAPMAARIIRAPLKGHNITEAQARLMAQALRRVARACEEFEVDEFTTAEFIILSDHPAYQQFHEAAFVAGFVCDDYSEFMELEPVRRTPRAIVPRMSFGQIRHYVHTLQRTEKNNSQGSTALWMAAQSGALDLIAERLDSDATLRS